MKDLKKKLLRPVTGLLATFGISTCFVACYGMPVNTEFNEADFTFHVVGDIDGNGTKEPVRGISISNAYGDESAVTDENGRATVSASYYGSDVKFAIDDVDGSENGSFKNQTYDFNADNMSSDDVIEIELEADDSQN